MYNDEIIVYRKRGLRKRYLSLVGSRRLHFVDMCLNANISNLHLQIIKLSVLIFKTVFVSKILVSNTESKKTTKFEVHSVCLEHLELY